jgi:hypothetical protein
MDVLLLLTQEMGRHRVEGVRPQLVFSEDHLEHVELYTAFDVDVLGVSCTEGF